MSVIDIVGLAVVAVALVFAGFLGARKIARTTRGRNQLAVWGGVFEIALAGVFVAVGIHWGLAALLAASGVLGLIYPFVAAHPNRAG